MNRFKKNGLKKISDVAFNKGSCLVCKNRSKFYHDALSLFGVSSVAAFIGGAIAGTVVLLNSKKHEETNYSKLLFWVLLVFFVVFGVTISIMTYRIIILPLEAFCRSTICQ
jgi:uncharacterized membrane protein